MPTITLANDLIIDQDKLMREFKKAVRSEDIDAALDLFDFERISQSEQEATREMLLELFREDRRKFRIKPLPEDYRPIRVKDGIRYRPNMPILGLIEVEFAPRGGRSSVSLPYGMKRKIYYFTNKIKESLYSDDNGENILIVSIVGEPFLNDDDEYKGRCVYKKESRDFEQRFTAQRNRSFTFRGNYVQSCEVTKTKGESPISLKITENGEHLYRSKYIGLGETIQFNVE